MSAHAILFSAALLTSALAVSAETRDVALGQDGEVYLAHVDSCAALFSGCPASIASHPAVAVDVMVPGAPIQRLLLPDSEGVEAEGLPTMVFENATSSLFVVWESRRLDGHSRVNLVWLRAGGWSPVVEISGDVAPLKGSPQLIVTRDQYEARSLAGSLVSQTRTTLHIAWWEQGSLVDEVYYTPIFIENGGFIGSNRVYNLTSMDPSPAPTSPLNLPDELLRSPRLENGRDGRSVVIGFVNARTQRFLSFESRVVPGSVTSMAQDLSAFISSEAIGNPSLTDLELAERIRAEVIELGYHFHPALTGYLAQAAGAQALTDPVGASGNAISLAERIRAEVIELGARGLEEQYASDGTSASLSTILETPAVEESRLAAHAIRLELVHAAPAPAVGEHGPYWFVLSPDGKRAVVSWPVPGSLHYRELSEGAWSAERSISLDGPVDSARAEQILRQRVREL